MTTDTPTIDGDTLDTLETYLTEHAVGRDNEIATDGGTDVDGTGRREVADQPALVTHCTGCGERVGLDRHIKSIGDRCYAVCYDCSPLGSAEEPQQQKLVTEGGGSA